MSSNSCSDNSALYVSGSNFTLNAGTSLIKLTVADAHFFGGTSTYNDITFTNASTSSTGNLYSGSTFHNVSFASNAMISNGAQNFNDVTIVGNGSFSGSHTFNDLTLTAGKTYTFNSSTTQTFNGNLNAIGTCSLPLEIFSGLTGSTATFSKASGNVTVSYVRLRDINCMGGASFNANNVTDLGNNTGWASITTSPGQTLYWTGNSGNWNDPAHWNLSGGTPANCIPTIYHDVVFNTQSFTGTGQSVNIAAISYCRNMTWLSLINPATLAGTSELNI